MLRPNRIGNIMNRVRMIIFCILSAISFVGCSGNHNSELQQVDRVKIPNEAFDVLYSENIKALGVEQSYDQLSFKIKETKSDLQWLYDIDSDFTQKNHLICVPKYGGSAYVPIKKMAGACRPQIFRYYYSEELKILVSLVGEYKNCDENCNDCGDILSVFVSIRMLDKNTNPDVAKDEFTNNLCKHGSVM